MENDNQSTLAPFAQRSSFGCLGGALIGVIFASCSQALILICSFLFSSLATGDLPTPLEAMKASLFFLALGLIFGGTLGALVGATFGLLAVSLDRYRKSLVLLAFVSGNTIGFAYRYFAHEQVLGSDSPDLLPTVLAAWGTGIAGAASSHLTMAWATAKGSRR